MIAFKLGRSMTTKTSTLCLFFISLFINFYGIASEISNSIECDQVCYYSPLNISASSLRNKLRIEVYKTGEPLYPDILQVSSDDSQVIFYSADSKTLNVLKSRILKLDKKPTFVKNVGGQVIVFVQVHAVETQGLDLFRFTLGGSYNKDRPNSNLDTVNIGNNQRGGIKFDFNFGNLASSIFKLAFDFSKTQAWSHKAASWALLKRSEDDLNTDSSSILYRPNDKSINTDKETVGFSVYGKVFISENKLVRFKNLSIRYSQPTNEPNSLLAAFSLGSMNFDLEPGKTRILAVNSVYMKSKSDKESLIFFRDKVADSSEVNLLFSISVELVDENQNSLTKDYSLTDAEIKTLPLGDDNSLQELMGHVLAYKVDGGILDSYGKKTGLQLDSKFLTQSSYDKYLTLRITNPDFDNLVVLDKKIQAQDLASQPVFYDFVDDFDKRCKQNAKLCLSPRLILEIGADTESQPELRHIRNLKFFIKDNRDYKKQFIVPFTESSGVQGAK